MPCYTKSKALVCLWLMMMLLVVSTSDEMGVRRDSCNCQFSREWKHGKACVKHGTCNKPCRAEGYENGSCEGFVLCYCCRNCDG